MEQAIIYAYISNHHMQRTRLHVKWDIGLFYSWPCLFVTGAFSISSLCPYVPFTISFLIQIITTRSNILAVGGCIYWLKYDVSTLYGNVLNSFTLLSPLLPIIPVIPMLLSCLFPLPSIYCMVDHPCYPCLYNAVALVWQQLRIIV